MELIEERKQKDSVTYRVIIPYYDLGKRKFYKKSFNSKKYGTKTNALNVAKKHRDEMKIKLGVEYIFEPKETTLEDVFDLKLKTYAQAPQTERRVKSILNKFIEPIIPLETPFKDITYIDILRTLTEAKTKASDDTLNRILSFWKQLYKTAIINDIIQVDQTIKVIKPKSLVPRKIKDQTTSYEELTKVLESLDHLKDKHNAKIIKDTLLIMYYTGIRPAECYALYKTDFNLDSMTLSISKAIRLDKDRKAFISTTKTNNSIRVIPFPEELLEVISGLPDEGAAFVKSNGSLLDGTFVSDMIKKNYKGNFTPYKLRHQFATDLIQSGVDIRTIQEMMGHSNSSTTVGYMRSSESKMQEALKRRNGNKMGTA